MQKTLVGIGEYGFGYPANWAQALLEITSGEERAQIFKALKEQQRLYLEKDDKNNKKARKSISGRRVKFNRIKAEKLGKFKPANIKFASWHRRAKRRQRSKI